MKAYHLTAAGRTLDEGLANLRQVDLETPAPGPGEVLIRQRAGALNYVDLLFVSGPYAPPVLPLIPVMDGAGEIAAKADDVDDFAVGDRVMPHVLPDWIDGPTPDFTGIRSRGFSVPGVLAEYAVVPARSLARIPTHLSFAEAATFSTAGTTAWNAMRDGKVGAGSTVLVLGTGNVSLFALLFARMLGARVILTSSSDERLEEGRQLGADAVINYRDTPEWDVAVRALTDGRGVDLVVETVGEQTFTRSVNATAKEGMIAAAGWRSGTTVPVPINRVQQRRLHIIGGMIGSIRDFCEMMQAVSDSGMRPKLANIFAFDDAADAYRALSRNASAGKIAIEV